MVPRIVGLMISLLSPESSWPSVIPGYQYLWISFIPVGYVLVAIIVFPWALAVTAFLFSNFVLVLPPRIFRFLREVLTGTERESRRLETGVWTIDGRRYDLTKFRDRHPGGAWALELGRNRDCTGLFESYHVFADMEKLRKILKQYELPGQPETQERWNSTGLVFGDAFHEDVKKMAQDYFREIGASWKMKTWVYWCVLATIAGEVLAAIGVLYGYRVCLVIMPILGGLLTFNVSHDASHFALSSRPIENAIFAYSSAPLYFNSTAWYIQHIVQHHVYTNDESDVDLYHFLPVVRTTRLTEYKDSFSLQWLLVWLVLPTSVAHLTFVVPVDLMTRYVDPILHTRRYQQCENVDDLVAASFPALLLEFCFSFGFPLSVMYVHGFVKGFCWMAIMYSICSFLFIGVTQGAHLQEECMVEKDAEKSWAKRQVLTAVNFRPDSLFWSLATGALNMQALHHILPTVSASHLRDLYPRFRIVCEKHGVELKEASGPIEFFGGFLSWVRELSLADLDQTAQDGKAKVH